MSQDESELAKKIEQALLASGDHERFKQFLRKRLEATGWFESLKVEAESKFGPLFTLSPLILLHCIPLLIPDQLFNDDIIGRLASSEVQLFRPYFSN